LPTSVGFGDAAGEFVVSSQVNVVQVQAIQQAFFLNLACKVFDFPFNIALSHVCRSDQRSQGRLVFDLAMTTFAQVPSSSFSLLCNVA